MGLRGGQKQYWKAPSHIFFILHNWLLQKLRFWEWHEIIRCGIFPMAQNIKKTLKLDKIEHFLLKSMQFYIKFWEYIRILWSMCFLEDLECKKISSTPIFAIFLSKAKTKIIKKLPQNHKLVEKRGLSDKRRYNNSYFFIEKFTFCCWPFFSDFLLENAQISMDIKIASLVQKL